MTYTIRVSDLSEAERMLVRVLTLDERRAALLTAARAKHESLTGEPGDTGGDTT